MFRFVEYVLEKIVFSLLLINLFYFKMVYLFFFSRNLVKSPQRFNDDRASSNFSKNCDSHSLLDFTSSLEKDDDDMKSFFSSSMHNEDSPESIACEKMSSDSAFQSLGDGLELEQVRHCKIGKITNILRTKIKATFQFSYKT